MARNWIKFQNKPSYKGVPFEVDAESVDGARSIVVHEYPNSENWDTEDLGRKSFNIEVSGYVCGNDAYEKAQALLAACTSNTGPGLLVLPARIPQTALCRRCKSSWVADEQGRITLDMEFVASSRLKGGIVPSATLANAVSNAADLSTRELIKQFSEDFNTRFRSFSQPVAVPSVAREAAGETIRLAAEALAAAFRAVFIPDETAAAKIDFGIRQLKERAAAYAAQGANPYRIDELVFVDDQDDTASAFSRVFDDTLKRMAKNADDPAVLVEALTPLISFAPQTLNNSDARALTVRAETALTNDVADFVRRMSLIRWAHALTRTPYVSKAQAVSAKGLLIETFDSELSDIDDPDIADPLKAVRWAAVDFLINNGAQLPRVLKITVAHALPACVIAGMLYADLEHGQDEELWERNGIESHPLLLPDVIEALAP